MAFTDHFERKADFRYECKHCRSLVDGVLPALLSHYTVCGGKQGLYTSRQIIDVLDEVSDTNKDLAHTIGALLHLRKREYIVMGGLRMEAVKWNEVKEILSMFGWEEEIPF